MKVNFRSINYTNKFVTTALTETNHPTQATDWNCTGGFPSYSIFMRAGRIYHSFWLDFQLTESSMSMDISQDLLIETIYQINSTYVSATTL